MKLQKYAYSISVGHIVKQRCKENVDILQEEIDQLPPSSVMKQYKLIKDELSKFAKQSNTISNAISLLNATKPYLLEMKSIVGSSNEAYLKLSTVVVRAALNNIIEEVNEAQKEDPFGFSLPHDIISRLKPVLRKAWDATLLMDTFDMESDFKNRYTDNRRILKDLCNQLGISTKTSTLSISKPAMTTNPITEKKTTSSVYTPQSSKQEKKPGCGWMIVASILLSWFGCIIGCIIGVMISGRSDSVGIFGALIGLGIGIKVMVRNNNNN